jgi:GntR family transcriptional regulator/MocR family aminotransferase
MEPFFEIDLARPAPDSRDATRLLHGQLRAAILDGRLPVGARLPPTRQAAAVFGVSRNTAVEVYDRLAAEGLVDARQGSGTRVGASRPRSAETARAATDAPQDARLNPFWLSAQVSDALGFWREPGDLRGGMPDVDLRPALVDARLFPHAAFRKASMGRLRDFERAPPASRSPYGHQGGFRLRQAITRHIALTRAVACRPDDVLVTAGAQQAFDILARALVRPGATVVAIEDPGYPPMRVAFAAAGARLVPVPVDRDGLIVERLPDDADIVCLCPSHQFPLGASMSTARRQALLAFARRRGAVIVEDDYDGEFRYDGSPLEALHAADGDGLVFYVGTFSKSMLPALRLGFVVAPPWALPTLVAVRNGLDWHGPTWVQAGVAEFIAAGHLTRHVRKMRNVYRRRRRFLMDALAQRFGRWLEPVPSTYGMHLAAIAKPGVDGDALAQALARRNIRIHSLRRFYLGEPTADGLVFGYGAADESQLRRSLAMLHEALR